LLIAANKERVIAKIEIMNEAVVMRTNYLNGITAQGITGAGIMS
jgi:hypothetical protein